MRLRLIDFKHLTSTEVDNIIDKVLAEIDTDSNEGSIQEQIRSEVKALRSLDANVVATPDACERIIDCMVERNLLACYDKIRYRVTSFGIEVLNKGGWLKNLKSIEEENRLDRQIKELTVKQLKGNIFQMKYWWLFLIVAGVIGAVFNELFQYLLSLIAEKGNN